MSSSAERQADTCYTVFPPLVTISPTPPGAPASFAASANLSSCWLAAERGTLDPERDLPLQKDAARIANSHLVLQDTGRSYAAYLRPRHARARPPPPALLSFRSACPRMVSAGGTSGGRGNPQKPECPSARRGLRLARHKA